MVWKERRYRHFWDPASLQPRLARLARRPSLFHTFNIPLTNFSKRMASLSRCIISSGKNAIKVSWMVLLRAGYVDLPQVDHFLSILFCNERRSRETKSRDEVARRSRETKSRDEVARRVARGESRERSTCFTCKILNLISKTDQLIWLANLISEYD